MAAADTAASDNVTVSTNSENLVTMSVNSNKKKLVKISKCLTVARHALVKTASGW